MIYSCFNENLGLYEYFEDARGHALNGDLPTPTHLGGKVAGKIGVPAREAGRPLPSSAKRVGKGFEARGMIVSCLPTAMMSLSGDTDAFDLGTRGFVLVTMAVLAAYGGYALYRDYVR